MIKIYSATIRYIFLLYKIILVPIFNAVKNYFTFNHCKIAGK